jgi:hypothetical protein
MQDEHDEITKLLRLKRYEQPEPEYFENFLEEFKERQRAQMLREPVWRIAWDRMCAFFGEQFPVRMGYGLASTAVLTAAAIASFNIVESHPGLGVAVVTAPPQQPAQMEQAAPIAETGQVASLNLNPQAQVPDLPSLDPNAHTVSFASPHYVMDARPVSYEPPSSF